MIDSRTSGDKSNHTYTHTYTYTSVLIKADQTPIIYTIYMIMISYTTLNKLARLITE